MSGTMIKNLKLEKVVDGDTVKVRINDELESLRLVCLDTEESRYAGGKPVTTAGKLASVWAREYFGANEKGMVSGDVRVDIEFDTSEPAPVCLRKHRGNYGRLICYVHKGGENYNLLAVRQGWSPYFVKYGRSRLYHEQFMLAEAHAQAKGLVIWDPQTNAGGQSRDYAALIPWWNLRDSVVQDFRSLGAEAGALSVRLDYEVLSEAARTGSRMTVLCDLQGGIRRSTENGAVVFAGSPKQKFNLWIPNHDEARAQEILYLLKHRYAGYGRNYVYVTGEGSTYPPRPDGKPQIVLRNIDQLSDLPPGL